MRCAVDAAVIPRIVHRQAVSKADGDSGVWAVVPRFPAAPCPVRRGPGVGAAMRSTGAPVLRSWLRFLIPWRRKPS